MHENELEAMFYDRYKIQTLFQEEKNQNTHSLKQKQVLHVLFANNVFLPQLAID